MRQTFKKFLAAALLAASFAFSSYSPAEAVTNILFAGGEDVDVIFVGSISVNTTNTNFRSSYARAALGVGAQAAADPPPNRFQTTVFANTASIWVHAENIQGNNTTLSGVQNIRVIGSDGNPRILVRNTGTAGQSKISTRNTAGTITDLVTCTSGGWPTTSLAKIDLFVNYAVSGEVSLYRDGVLLCDFVGDVTTNGITSVKQVEFSSTTNAATAFWSEIIVADGDTRNMNLVTLAPVAAGNTQLWSGVVGNINPTTINDTNIISDANSNELSQWTVGSLPSGSFSVAAVAQVARVVIGTSGPQNFRWSARVSGSDYDNGADVLGTTSFANYSKIWATSPATSSAWTTGELGAGVNFGLKSRP